MKDIDFDSFYVAHKSQYWVVNYCRVTRLATTKRHLQKCAKKKNLLTFGCNIYAFLPSLVASDIITSIDWTPEKMTVMNWCLLINIFSVNNIFSEFVMLRLDSAINSLHNKHSPGQYSTTHLIDLMLSHQTCQRNFVDLIILRYEFWWLLPRTTTVLN